MSVFQSDLLAGQVAFVTGGGSGITRQVVLALMRHGCDVTIASRNGERLAQAAAELSAETGRACLPVVCDVRHPEQVEAALKATLDRFGKLDIVVNGAAGNFLAPVEKLSYNAFKTVIEIDTLGTFNVCKAAFEASLKANGGVILSISATLHYTGTPFQAHAGTAKAGIDALTRHLAMEWGPLGIRVNAVAPGPIGDTEGMRRLAPGEIGERLKRKIPLRRFGTTQDIADAALYLCSNAASYVTGTVLVVDGGAWMMGSMLEGL